MMPALPAGPTPAPRRQVFVGTAIAGVASMMLIGGMLAVWVLQRERSIDAVGTWLPEGVTIPEVPTNVMLIGIWALTVFAQWALYAARRKDRSHTGLALGLVAVIVIALINAQAFVYSQIELPVAEGGYPGMFYAVTGVMTALLVIGLGYTAVTAFRYLGGRIDDTEIIAAHALHWYVLAAIYSAVWLIVYVIK